MSWGKEVTLIGYSVDERSVFTFEQVPSEWVIAGTSGGANALWLTEWLTTELDLRPGMLREQLTPYPGGVKGFLHAPRSQNEYFVDLREDFTYTTDPLV